MTREPLHGEQGLSLVELLVAMTVGMIVLGAVLGLLETAQPAQVRTSDRVDATARARRAMDLITMRLRSQGCFDEEVPPVLDGSTGDRLRFYSSLLEPGGSELQLRELRHDAASRTIVEQVWDTPADPPQSPAAIPTTGTARASRLLAEGAEPVPGGVFRYFAFGTGGQQVELTALPLSRTEAQRVVRIDVRLAAVGSLGDPAQGTTLLNQVHLRLADPDQPTSNPC